MSDDVATLKARIAELEEENRFLRSTVRLALPLAETASVVDFVEGSQVDLDGELHGITHRRAVGLDVTELVLQRLQLSNNA